MCGKCCRVSTTLQSYQELSALAEQGDEEAKDFLSIFEPYNSIDDARAVCANTVENVLLRLKDAVEVPEDINFYKCKYILDNNLCGNYENRPELCKRFPSSAWAIVPPGCGYEGWMFQEREKIKQGIRRKKEDLMDYEIGLKTSKNPENIKKLEEAIEKIKNIIKMYEKYGSADW